MLRWQLPPSKAKAKSTEGKQQTPKRKRDEESDDESGERTAKHAKTRAGASAPSAPAGLGKASRSSAPAQPVSAATSAVIASGSGNVGGVFADPPLPLPQPPPFAVLANRTVLAVEKTAANVQR